MTAVKVGRGIKFALPGADLLRAQPVRGKVVDQSFLDRTFQDAPTGDDVQVGRPGAEVRLRQVGNSGVNVGPVELLQRQGAHASKSEDGLLATIDDLFVGWGLGSRRKRRF